MTESPSQGSLEMVRRLPDELATVLGLEPGEVIGVPLAISFLVRTDQPGRFFVSGLTPDFASAAIQSIGGQVTVEPPDDDADDDTHDGTDLDPPGRAVIFIADEAWSAAGNGTSVGLGPVALAPSADPSQFTNSRQLIVVAGTPHERTRLERAEHLRALFSLVAQRLAGEIAPAVDWSLLARINGPAQLWMVEALTAVAATRSAVGSYLIDQADELDDERIDQLGDGYVRTAELWRYLAAGDLAVGPELHELERSCVAWMRSAAARPTRYAF